MVSFLKSYFFFVVASTRTSRTPPVCSCAAYSATFLYFFFRAEVRPPPLRRPHTPRDSTAHSLLPASTSDSTLRRTNPRARPVRVMANMTPAVWKISLTWDSGTSAKRAISFGPKAWVATPPLVPATFLFLRLHPEGEWRWEGDAVRNFAVVVVAVAGGGATPAAESHARASWKAGWLKAKEGERHSRWPGRAPPSPLTARALAAPARYGLAHGLGQHPLSFSVLLSALVYACALLRVPGLDDQSVARSQPIFPRDFPRFHLVRQHFLGKMAA